MASLERLEVSCNQLTGSIPAEFGKLPSLRKLYAAANKLSGTLPEALAGAKQLNDLLLYGNQLTVRTVVWCCCWHVVAAGHSVHLPCVCVQGTLPVAWKALAQLDLLSLGLNKLSGAWEGVCLCSKA